MPTGYAPTDVSNLALAKVGAQQINSLLDTTNASALQCNLNYNLAYLAVSRATRWNCILGLAVLTQVPQSPLSALQQGVPPTSVPWAPFTAYTLGQYVSNSGTYYTVLTNYTSSALITTDLNAGNLQVYNTNGPTVVNATPWAPLTFYQANAFLSYGGYYYTVNFSYTSTQNFTNDLTAGYLSQTDQQAGTSVTDPFANYQSGSQYASGWAYAYALPSDFVLMDSLNANVGANGSTGFTGEESDDYEIIGGNLYCDQNQAVIQYVQNVTDSSQFDPMFLDAITFKLASMIATPLRMDGGRMEAELIAGYERILRQARTKNAGEKQVRRFNPIASSNFNRARFGGVNG